MDLFGFYSILVLGFRDIARGCQMRVLLFFSNPYDGPVVHENTTTIKPNTNKQTNNKQTNMASVHPKRSNGGVQQKMVYDTGDTYEGGWSTDGTTKEVHKRIRC